MNMDASHPQPRIDCLRMNPFRRENQKLFAPRALLGHRAESRPHRLRNGGCDRKVVHNNHCSGGQVANRQKQTVECGRQHRRVKCRQIDPAIDAAKFFCDQARRGGLSSPFGADNKRGAALLRDGVDQRSARQAEPRKRGATPSMAEDEKETEGSCLGVAPRSATSARPIREMRSRVKGSITLVLTSNTLSRSALVRERRLTSRCLIVSTQWARSPSTAFSDSLWSMSRSSPKSIAARSTAS